MLRNIKISAVFLIVFALFITGVSSVDYGGDFWGKETIAIMIERGVITPDASGNIKPNQAITRAEAAAAINKNFGFTQTTAINYTDVNPADWFYRDLQIARAAGYMIGDANGGFRPNANLSREELSTIIGRILELPDGGQFARDFFVDFSAISHWSAEYVGAMAREGILIGYENGEFRPRNNVTRAEAYAILLRSEKTLTAKNNGKLDIDSATVTQSIRDREYLDLIVSNGGVTLENIIVNGDLIIDSRVARGSVTLTNVQVIGITYIRGGGSASVTANRCRFNDIIINSAFNTRFVLNGTENRDSVGKIIAVTGGTIDNRHTRLQPDIAVAGGILSTANVNITGNANVIDINAGANINFDGNVKEFNINEYASGVNLVLPSGAVAETVNINSSNITISGDGVISTAKLSGKAWGVTLNSVVNNIISESADGVSVVQRNFQSLAVGSVTGNTTTLLAVFDRDIPDGLRSADITVRNANFVSVTGSGRNYTITVSNAAASGVSVTIQKPGYHITNATRTVNPSLINFTNLTANGSSTVPTTSLTITFDRVVPGLAAADFTVTGAARGVLSGSGPSYTLEISNITVSDLQNVTVAVAKSGLTFDPASRTVPVNRPSIGFTGLTANGTANSSGTVTANTTQLTLNFDSDISGGLTRDDITVTGINNTASAATVIAVNRVGSSWRNYTVDIGAITVSDNTEVRVTVEKSGIVFTGVNNTPSRLVRLRKMTDASFSSLARNGSPSGISGSPTETTTTLTLTFDRNIPGLTASDITVTGATKGSLTQDANNNRIYYLNITNITVDDTESVRVWVARPNLNIIPAFREIAVRKTADDRIAFTNLEINAARTQLTVTFDKPVSGLSASNFTATFINTSNNTTSATIGTLTQNSTNANVYTLGINNITNANSAITLNVSRSGFTFTPSSRAVTPAFVAVTDITGVPTVATAGTALTLTGTVAPATATNRTIVWSIVNRTGSGLTTSNTTITNNNRLNTPANTSGTVRVRATITDGRATSGSNRNYTKEFDISVRVPPNITSANNTSVQNGTGATFQVTATGTAPINYSLSGAPAGVTINNTSGLITITGATAVGAHTFTITANNETINASQSFTLTVIAATVPVTGVTLNHTSLSLTANQEQQLTATVNPSDATNKAVTWESSNASVAGVDSNGHVIAVGAGTAIITVKTTDGNFTATCLVTVSAPVTVDRTALKATIAEANEAKSGIQTSDNGNNVPATEKWVTELVMSTFLNAILTAEIVDYNQAATQAQVDAAVTELNNAISEFKKAIQQGLS